MTQSQPSDLYLDYAAATPVDEAVLRQMMPYFAVEFYNPSALYGAARDVRAAVEAARGRVSDCLGARPVEIVFTAGGSEANNLAIHGVMRREIERAGGHGARVPRPNILVSAIEHDSVRGTADEYECRLMPVDEQGVIKMGRIHDLIDDNTVLVSCMYANNEIGTIQPIRELATVVSMTRRERLRRGVVTPLYLHVDAAQAANYLDLQVARLGVDLMSLNGGKIYGPKQTGALFVRSGVELKPLVYGGGQESGLRSGTENVPGIVGFAAALVAAQAARRAEARRLQAVQRHFYERLPEFVPGAVVNGSRKHRLPNNLHITIPGTDNERLMYGLDELGIQAAAGSACSASSETPSHVLGACGLSDEAARSSLRFTMGRATVDDDMDRLLEALKSLLA